MSEPNQRNTAFVGVPERNNKLHSRFWTTGAVRTVLAAIAKGATYEEAGALVGRSKHGVSFMIRSNPNAPRLPRGRRPWKDRG